MGNETGGSDTKAITIKHLKSYLKCNGLHNEINALFFINFKKIWRHHFFLQFGYLVLGRSVDLCMAVI